MFLGLLLLDKPAGVTSARALDGWRPRGGTRRTLPRIGHAGTLDPFATGMLLVLLGEATRLKRLAQALPKVYRATVRFGIETETLDPEGAVSRIADPGEHPPPELAAVLDAHVGRIRQTPPIYSALHVGGARAYALARSGQRPELPEREVRIDAIRLLACRWPEVDLEVQCGPGTYLRALARDLGLALGLPATLRALRRTAIGPFRVEDAAPLAAPDPLHIRPPKDLVAAAGIPFAHVTPEEALTFARGNPIHVAARAPEVGVLLDGALVGLGQHHGNGKVMGGLVFGSVRERLEA